jgi:hypothetical protein
MIFTYLASLHTLGGVVATALPAVPKLQQQVSRYVIKHAVDAKGLVKEI